MGSRLIGLVVGLVVLGLACGVIEKLFRSADAPPWYRRSDVKTDLAYWFFTPLVSRGVTAAVVALVVTAIVVISGGSLEALRAEIAAGRPPAIGPAWMAAGLASLPFAAQLLLGLAISDFISYWMHRAFHRAPLWALHAVHHASPRLDWLSSVRLHPLNQAAMRVMQAVPLLFLGFDASVFAVVAPFFAIYAIMLHANVNWSFGPLRHVVATPCFHRWHHTAGGGPRQELRRPLPDLGPLLRHLLHARRHRPHRVRRRRRARASRDVAPARLSVPPAARGRAAGVGDHLEEPPTLPIRMTSGDHRGRRWRHVSRGLVLETSWIALGRVTG